jgi:hypothetical protein
MRRGRRYILASRHPKTVIAGLVPATPIARHGRAKLIGVAGTSPAMTIRENRTRYHFSGTSKIFGPPVRSR